MLDLKLLVSLVELPEGLLGDFQPRRKLGVLIQEWVRSAVGQARNEIIPCLPPHYNIKLSGRVLESQHLMRLPEDVVSIEQPLELLGSQRHHLLLQSLGQ